MDEIEQRPGEIRNTFRKRRWRTIKRTQNGGAEIVSLLKQTYCGTFAVEFLDIRDPEQRAWLIEKMEPTLNKIAMETNSSSTHLRSATSRPVASSWASCGIFIPRSV